jgi:flagellar protein FlbD
MIHLTRLNHEDVLVNSDLIVLVEANPDTVISLTTGERVRVLETLPELTQRVVDFKRLVLNQAKLVGGSGDNG